MDAKQHNALQDIVEQKPGAALLSERRVPIWVVGGISLGVLLLDQISKLLVLTYLGPARQDGPVQIVIIPRVLRLIYVENTGAAFGVLQGRNPALAFLAVIVVAILAVWFRSIATTSRWGALALGLQIGGALGNVLDRFRHGFVIDFIDVPHWPTFNLADSAITVGVILLALILLERDFRARKG
jgi:signal peptidase II